MGTMSFAFPKEVYSETVGGVEFDVLYVTTSVPAGTVKQKYYSIVTKGYALNLIVSFWTDEEESDLAKILESVAFAQE